MESKLTDLPDLTPSGDYALNSFLLKLNDDLDDDDLEKLKFLCTGNNKNNSSQCCLMIKMS